MIFGENYTVRTDMADEIAEGLSGKRGVYGDGVSFYGKSDGSVRVDKMIVKHDMVLGDSFKPVGKYVTVTVEKDCFADRECFERAASAVAEGIGELLPKKMGLCLVVCLGNRELIADAIGPLAAEKIVVSRHIKINNKNLFNVMELGECACISTGVTGQTGAEAAEIAKGAVEILKPDSVIVIDALASGRLSRLMRTVQISDAGISPGSGVNNSRSEISFSTLGVPVIAVGVPTVVEASVVCRDLFRESEENKKIEEGRQNNKEQTEDKSDFFVTVKDADVHVKIMAKLVGYGINKAVHKSMSFSEMEELLS